MNFGIIGAGNIANTMATTLTQMSEPTCYAIASRSMEKAEAFREKFGMEKAYDSYEGLAKDPDVDVIYIATPHSFHYEQAKMCLENGKHVLLEKAFCANASQAKKLIEISESKGLFLGEAMWTRFMPLAKKLREMLDEGVIGEVMYMTANLNFPMMHKERLVKAELAGGALLDVGIYPLTAASLVMGDNIKDINATALLNDENMDLVGQYILTFDEGGIAYLNSGMCFESDGNAVIIGTDGSIVMEGVNFIRGLRVFDGNHNEIEYISFEDVDKYPYGNDETITGYEYEVLGCMDAIKKGHTECPEITHKETLFMMETMDEIRRQMGVIYPFEF